MSESIALRLENVSKTFRIRSNKDSTLFEFLTSFWKNNVDEELKVLQNINLTIHKGETLGILGLNGAGKSTLLKILAQIYAPDSGTLHVNGKLTPFLDLGTGFNGELSARENVYVYGILLGLSKKQITDKIGDIFEYAELEKFKNTKLKNFSSGMVARLAFSTAITVDPDVLLVDEVLAVGDALFRQKSYKAFLDFKQKNKTIIIVSHSVTQIQDLCDRAILLFNGKIISDGVPDVVAKEYAKLIDTKS